MKITKTVSDLLNNYPGVSKRCENGDVLLAAARELGDSVPFELIAANRRLAECDPDNEHEFDAAVIGLRQAEAAFLNAHAGTEVTL
jgi:hypothetical protein